MGTHPPSQHSDHTVHLYNYSAMQPFLTTHKAHTLKDAFCKNNLILDENISWRLKLDQKLTNPPGPQCVSTTLIRNTS